MGFSIRYMAYETQAALLQQSTASLNSSEALHALYAKLCGFLWWHSDTILWIFFQYVVILFFMLHISNKIVSMFYTFSFCSQILLPSPDPSITWVVSTQADISERSRSFWSHLYFPVQVPVVWREYRPMHHLYC